ncbi:unnamed protein product [Arctia plantaginis]|uniref:Uncharacterized protein n=1 Tax=Arctia plantaginis TaxID=874455 RepID=A0A8S0ZXH1_ARCPL|nr:unnamed protein product [Arctia plantaginis]
MIILVVANQLTGGHKLMKDGRDAFYIIIRIDVSTDNQIKIQKKDSEEHRELYTKIRDDLIIGKKTVGRVNVCFMQFLVQYR